MLVKYLGKSFDNEKKELKLRNSFLSDGLFRITQPKFLNDKGSEFKLYPYFNEFSPSDYDWAMKEYLSNSRGNYLPSQKELEDFYLKPLSKRYGEEFPGLLNAEAVLSLDDYDKKEFEKTVESFNRIIIESLSCHVGVFSLCKNDTNEHMWTHYASEGAGIAVVFDDSHDFFKQHPFREVKYKEENRASLSFYKGAVRINGVKIKTSKINSDVRTWIILSGLYNPMITEDFCERLVFTKSQKWSIEDEVRILFDITERDAERMTIATPEIDDSIKNIYPSAFPNYPLVCLKKIPFDAIKNIILGFSIDKYEEIEIIKLISDNPALSHVTLKRARHNVFGEIIIEDAFRI